MVDRHRNESPGAWHHVMNRGTARRTVIETRQDAAEFFACVQLVVEEGILEVHACCLMGTHFHMLVRSPQGELARAMMLLLNRYARWFNRGRRRDGPLWRGRFLSKRILTDEYWRILVRYIDQNPVVAGIVRIPGAYEFGSAWHYSRTNSRPQWLTRSRVEAVVMEQCSTSLYDPRDYHTVFGHSLSASQHWMLDRHGFSKADPEDTFSNLVTAAPERVQSWMRRKALRADGEPTIGMGLIEPTVLLAAIDHSASLDPSWSIRRGRRSSSGWQALRCALLHQLSGCTFEDIAQRTDHSESTARRHVKEHTLRLLDDPNYEQRSSQVLTSVLASQF